MKYKIGLDVGSTTIKCAVIDENGKIIYKSYERHFAKAREKSAELLKHIKNSIIDKNGDVLLAVTGSSGLGLSQLSGIDFVQEVYSTQLAVREYYPDADAIIELGGEDAKILFLSGVTEVRMNGSCAGGTGSFIDQMSVLLGVSLEEFDKLSMDYEKLYTIASRCGVFAKSDIQPLVNQGAKKNDLAASIFQAVVNQTIGGLAQGREIEGKIIFLGGPLSYFDGLKARFTETLGLDSDNAIFPENGKYFIAMGAAIYAGMNDVCEIKLENVIKKLEQKSTNKAPANIKPLFENEGAYKEFLTRHNSRTIKRIDLNNNGGYEGDAFLGIDAGSTTTKIVLITVGGDSAGDIIYEKYINNTGNAVPIVKNALLEIYKLIDGKNIKIKGSAVTGYGEELIKNAFNLDFGLVETVAHYTAARFFMPEVDFIIDIGGQDMKCFKMKQNAVDSIMLNEACSSGCGSFLETFATALGYTVDEFAKLGLFAEHPVDLGSRCTVFMNSSVKQAQKDGATIADISAGLSISVVKNAIYKVIRANSPKDLGHNIVVQGGTFLNDAVLRAFEKELSANVVRTPISGLMGAYGCALYASAQNLEGSAVLKTDDLVNFEHRVGAAVCKQCENHCRLTVNKFSGGKTYVSGNRCERHTGKSEQNIKYNQYEYKYEKLKSMETSGHKSGRGKIGIPLVLNMYENLPFWHAFFDSLGFEIVLSPRSNRELYVKGQHTIPSDTVCYPAKLVHGHIEALVENGADVIFYPCMSYNFNEKSGDNHYNCPVVAYYPEVVESNMPAVKKVTYIYDYFGIHRKKDFIKKAAGIFSKYFKVTPEEIKKAAVKAYKAYGEFRADMLRYAEEAVKYADENGLPVIVLAGRPYHADPEINHGIDKLITGYGAVVISEDGIPVEKYKTKVNVLNQWTYHSRMYAAANAVSKYKDMSLIQLVSFGCGVDSITTDEMRSILEKEGQIYTQIKIDEINNLGAVKIRIRSLFAALDERKKGGR